MSLSSGDDLGIEAALPGLRRFASRLVEDDQLAADLVDLVVEETRRQIALTPAREALQPMMFSLMRAAFHSVERRRLSSARRGDAVPVHKTIDYTFLRREP